MKIIHSSGEEYSLTPGTQLIVERSNPFFNGFGEHSLPVTIPADAKNRRLMSYPDDITGISKMSQRSDAMIMHGIYAIPCRQAILSGNKKKGIETSFYLNTGAFYEKIKDVQLSTIFKDRVVPFNSVSEAIAFCRGLYINYDERFACFPVDIENGTLNLRGSDAADGYPRLYNDESRTEVVDDVTIRLDPGFYVTPFIRAKYLLKEVFSWFGYRLSDSFFSLTAPFSGMVFLNNTIDTIVKGEIRLSQIVPDCSVSTILDVYRNRFNCEFIPDEANKIMNIVLFDEVLASSPGESIDACLVEEYTVSHPETFKQLQLSTTQITPGSINMERRVGAQEEVNPETKTLAELLKKYPELEYNPISGEFTRVGFTGPGKTIQRLGFITMNYLDVGDLQTDKKDSPDASPVMTYSTRAGGSSARPDTVERKYLNIYIGAGRALNSTIEMDGVDSESEETTTDSSNAELKPMLCFVGRKSNGKDDFGTILNYDADGNRLWEYTLAFHGADGLFEKFWRRYDDMLRNSLLEVRATLLLDDKQKATMSEYKKVILDGQELLPNVIKYTPDSFQPQEATFYTVKLYEPINSAISESERLQPFISPYYWEASYTQSVNDPNRRRWSFKEQPVTIFRKPPTEDEFSRGGRFYEATYAVVFYRSSPNESDAVEGTITVWLEARRK